MEKLRLNTIGGPGLHTHHHRLRSFAAIAALIAGGLAIFGVAYALIAGIMPADSWAMWGAIVVLGLVCISGVWWRSDAPDARDRYYERERRGY
jgi:hypothetical protein